MVLLEETNCGSYFLKGQKDYDFYSPPGSIVKAYEVVDK
jgi:hypothetical protein